MFTNVSPAARAVHRAILRGFATVGQAPDRAALTRAVPAGHDLDPVLAELHDRDVIRLDERGRIRAAYPFSAAPTAHLVAIDAGPVVYAMCAVDALGIAAMLGRDTVITSADPATGNRVQVSVHAGQAVWRPATAVVFTCRDNPAGDDQPGSAPAAERCCTVMNFFTGPDTAATWRADHPGVSGVMLSQEQALRLGADIFGRLLDEPPEKA